MPWVNSCDQVSPDHVSSAVSSWHASIHCMLVTVPALSELRVVPCPSLKGFVVLLAPPPPRCLSFSKCDLVSVFRLLASMCVQRRTKNELRLKRLDELRIWFVAPPPSSSPPPSCHCRCMSRPVLEFMGCPLATSAPTLQLSSQMNTHVHPPPSVTAHSGTVLLGSWLGWPDTCVCGWVD